MDTTFTVLPMLDRDLLACMRDLEYMTWERIADNFLISVEDAKRNYEAAPFSYRKGGR